MTLTDIISQSPKLYQSFSMLNLPDKKDQHRKFTRMNISILNLLPWHRQANILAKKYKNVQSQQGNSFLNPSSVITTSELSRSISNKSITFASVFDELENKDINQNNQPSFDLSASIENEDLVIVVPDKHDNNELKLNSSNSTTEPYPFRSEIPSYSISKCNKSSNVVNTCHSKKKLLHRLIHYHRPKKVRHPVKPIPTVNKINRSKSAPNMLFSLSSTTTTTTTNIITTNDNYQSTKTFRRWLQSSSFGQFLQSFIKRPNRNPNTSLKKDHKQKSCLKATTSRKYADLIY